MGEDQRQQKKEQSADPIVQMVKGASDLNNYGSCRIASSIVVSSPYSPQRLKLILLSVIKQNLKFALRTFVFQPIS